MKYKLFLFLFLASLTSWSQEYKKMISKGTYSVQEIQIKANAYFSKVGTEKGKGYKSYKRWEYQALRDMDESGMLKSPSFYYEELERYNSYLNKKNSGKQIASAAKVGGWQELGPTVRNEGSGNGWNPGVGRITSIAVDKTNTNHIIAGANTGGVWKTLDGGATWSVLTDNLSNITVYSLAIDPTDSSTYFWGADSVIFKSTDGGATWNLLSNNVGGGIVNKILINPNDTSKMYCTVQYSGIYKSTDGGLTWTIIKAGVNDGYDVEFKPGDTNTVYASGSSFYKSTDGGTTFTEINSGSSITNWTQNQVSGATDWKVATANQNGSVTPKTGAKMGYFYQGGYTYPVTQLVTPVMDLSGATGPTLSFSHTQADWSGDIDELRVLYKTSAAGTWTELANYTSAIASWTDVVINLPNASSEYYVAFEAKAKYGRGVTLDDVVVSDPTLGAVFSDGFESNTTGFAAGAKMIGVSADDPSVVYVLEANSGKFGAFYKSTDSGSTFVQLDHTGKNYFGYKSDASDDRGQAPRDMDIAVNPTDVDDVHIAGILTWRSTDGGVTFNVTSQWIPSTAANENIGYCHADVDILEYIDGKLYVGSDGGISVANTPTVINSSLYTELTTGMGIRQFYKFGVSQTDPEVITGGAQDNGTSAYDGATWKSWLGADGMESFVDKNDNNILYGTSQSGSLYKSTNLGATYFGIAIPDNKQGNWVTPFEQDPVAQDVIYAGYDQVYKSTNGGGVWNAISQNLGGNLDELKIAPSDNQTLYASRGSNLYKTTNGGATNWVALSGFSGSINAIAIHPTNPNKVAIATTDAQKVFVSDDGGTTWTSYLYDLPNFAALALVWEDNGDDGLYLGMNYGVYYIDNNSGNSWTLFNNGLPNVKISELEINTATNKLYAATYGRGVWKSNLFNDAALGVDATNLELKNIAVFPNPTSKQLNISWSKKEPVSVRIYDALGKLVYYSKNQSLLNTLTINVSHLQRGMYFVKINSNKGVATQKIILK